MHFRERNGSELCRRVETTAVRRSRPVVFQRDIEAHTEDYSPGPHHCAFDNEHGAELPFLEALHQDSQEEEV